MDPLQDQLQDTAPEWERRSFLKTATLLGAGLFWMGSPSSPYPVQAEEAPVLYGYGGITSIAIADDCARLARHAGKVGTTFKEVLQRNVNQEIPGNMALLGGMVPMDGKDAVTLLGRFREEEGNGGRTRQKLALVLGWLAHRAARQQLVPLYEAAKPTRPGLYPSEITIYHDATVLRHRSAGRDNAGNGQAVESTVRLFREIGPRMLIRFHTLIPDYDDGAGWIGRLATWRNEEVALMRRLVEAYQAPDPEKQQRYVEEPNFYDEDDVLIRVARALQEEVPLPVPVDEAVAEATEGHSRYAQAVQQGYRYLEAASEYFSAAISEAELISRLDA